ncbi:U32 family peptidase [bacterium]|nr:U32 family peptidase [bacterium]
MKKPEVLAPVGDFEVLHAALQAGADAVYFGLSEGFNARARAQNFNAARLPAIINEIHQRGAKAYITLNTLVFEQELNTVKGLLEKIQASGADALIMQDLGAVRLAQRFAPSLSIHASTQMTLSDVQSVKLAQSLNLKRTVLARELSAAEIKEISEKTACELEIFALGALCVSFSGQCLASLTWGGRSANRGQCAQPCRLPFRYAAAPLHTPLDFSKGDIKVSSPEHLMSPCDLAGFEQISALIKAGVSSLKIEGRLKGANYVYLAVKTVREWVDAHFDRRGEYKEPGTEDLLRLRNNLSDLTVTFSRGFTPGFLKEYNHRDFVQRGYPRHRGQLLGFVTGKDRRSVTVSPPPPSAKEDKTIQAAPISPLNGMGVLFLSENSLLNKEGEIQGGPIFSCQAKRGSWQLGFGHNGPDLQKVNIGDSVYISSSPAVNKKVEAAMNAPCLGRIPIDLKISGNCGRPLQAEAEIPGLPGPIRLQSQAELSPAQKNALNFPSLWEKLSELKGTPFHLSSLNTDGLEEGLFLPLSELKPLRRELVQKLEECLGEQEEQRRKRSAAPMQPPAPEDTKVSLRPGLIILCRTPEQVRAALDQDCVHLELEAFKPGVLNDLLKAAQTSQDLDIALALPRIQKNGEEALLDRYLQLSPQALLIRSLGSLAYLRQLKAQSKKIPALHGDFSLNITNTLSADLFWRLGLSTVTLSDDLDEESVLSFISSLRNLKASYPAPPSPLQRAVLTVYRRMPAFHTQHCLYANLLSKGKDKRDCGRPCLKNDLYLIDRRQFAHAVKTDYLCRNTVFSQTPVKRDGLIPKLKESGLGGFRIEFLDESYEQCLNILEYYRRQIY